MNVGLPLFDPDEKGILIWRCKRIEIVLRTSCDQVNLETGGTVWHAAHRLAEYLIKNPSVVRNKRVLELGCGCGLVGLVAAALGAKSVYMTDIDNQVPIIQENINLNKFLRTLKNKGTQDNFNNCQVTCGAMWFGERVGDIEEDKYDVVLGADIGYDVSLQEPIAMTLYSALVNKKSVAMLAEEVRWKDVYSWYVEALTGNDLSNENCELVRSGGVGSVSTNSIKGSVLRDNGSSTKVLGTNGTIYHQTDNNETMGLRKSFLHFGTYDSVDNNNNTVSYNNTPNNVNATAQSLDMIDLEDSEESSNVATLMKYPCAGLTDKNTLVNSQLLEALIEKICSRGSKTEVAEAEQLGSEVVLRVSMCPVKILKTTRKKR